jgi:hypothetical protein
MTYIWWCIAIACLVGALVSTGCTTVRAAEPTVDELMPEVTIQWLGAVTYSKITTDEAGTKAPNVLAHEQYAIGLRSDGVVVWREVAVRE